MQVALNFHEQSIHTLVRNGQVYLKGKDIAQALGYANPHKIAELYRQYQTEFDSEMVIREKVKSLKPETGSNNRINGLSVDALYFNRRGAWLIGMLSKAKKAKEFRKWVLDVLENHVEDKKQPEKQAAPAGLPENVTSTLKSVLRGNEIAMKKRETSEHLRLASDDMTKDYAKDADSLKIMSKSIEQDIDNILIMNSVQIEMLLDGGSPFDRPEPSMRDFLDRVAARC